MRFFAILALFLFLAACSAVPFSKNLKPHPQQQNRLTAEESFLAAMEQFSTANKLTQMQQVQQQFPGSVWAAHAKTIILYAQELDTRKSQLSSERAEKNQLLAELASVKQENLQLNEKIEQLKALLIDLEQRQH